MDKWISVLVLLFVKECSANGKYPWTYEDVFGGPDFWGLLNAEWRMCSNGRQQSPVNIEPSSLLFDPRLKQLQVSTPDIKVSGKLENAGQVPVLTLDDSKSATKGRIVAINITGGPLAGYHYNLYQIVFHFGDKTKRHGSEHTIDGERFPGEIQFLGYNTDLYKNFSDAASKPRGIVAIAVMMDIGHGSDPELQRITLASREITYKGMKKAVHKFSPYNLMPPTSHYVTYEGSLTYPGCYETVTWIIMNKPIYLTFDDYGRWNDLQQSESKQSPPRYMVPNFRPLKDLNNRLIRTNINFKTKGSSACPTMYKDMYYRANPNRVKSNRISDSGKKRAAIVIDKN